MGKVAPFGRFTTVGVSAARASSAAISSFRFWSSTILRLA